MEGHPLPPQPAGGGAVAMDAPTNPRPAILGPRGERRLLSLAVAGALITLVAFLADHEAAWAGLLVAGQFALGLALGGLLFLVFTYVMKAGWSVALRRIPEAMAGALPHAGGFVLLTLLVSLGAYEWSHADAVAGDALLQHKSGWLNVGAVLVRAVVCLGLWALFARALVRASRRQDLSGDLAETRRCVHLSCAFLAVFAVTFSVASFDWIMSLEAHWFSTVFAIYTFSGVFLSGVAAIILLAVALRRFGPLRDVVRPDHLHDLAKLAFGFTVFWAYIWFCQYMLIWYSDIPEETTYYVSRMKAPWHPWMLLNVAVNWLAPFLLLLPRPAKRNEAILVRVALLLLLGRLLDLHLMVAPPVVGAQPWSLLWTLGPIALALPLLVLVILRRFREAAPVPAADPFVGESLHHHV
jgi:hypothetical protein